ncbi:MAG: ATP-binding protein [Magnetospirillum sp.]|nr:ATP-binding protein [Magnetospirillum sp.]
MKLPKPVRSLLPDTVLGHTALVLVAALVLSLGAALAVFAVQRREALMALGVHDGAERVAALARLLEQMPADRRQPMLRSMDTPGFRAGLGTEPLVIEDLGEGMAAAMAEHLRGDISGHEVRVSSLPPGRGPSSHHGFGRDAISHVDTGFGPALRISVRLADGMWLNVFAPLDVPGTLWRAKFLIPVMLSLLIVTAVALWAVGRAARPFATFAAAAERLGIDVAAPRLAETGPREVRRAAHAFNVMQERIRRFVEDRTRMLAAISHDLRTPITRLKLRAEFVEDEDERARMLADLDEMERMIAATLAFARDDAACEEHRAIDVAALAQGLVDDMVAAGADAAYEGPDHLVMAARPMALKRAIANLLENAVKYGRRARMRLDEAGAEAVMVIDDDGPGIPEADRERVFSPFVRLERSRSRDTGGTGLGLSVARASIRAHGGEIVLANRPEGGLRVRVLLPRA